MAEFQKIMVPLFQHIACCINNSHYQVAERTHSLWNNEHIFNLIMHNRQLIFPLIFPALKQNSQNYWNQAVLNLTQNIRKMFCEMDEELVLACQHKLEEENSQLSEVVQKRKLTWERLETTTGFKPVAANIIPSVKPAACVKWWLATK
ncbi:hypothetical protein CRYUN_Cryun34aG0000300 [Craigia yunnanensis]